MAVASTGLDGARAGTGAVRPATFADALASEWTKLRTVRSTFWGLAVATGLAVGLGALIAGARAGHYHEQPFWDPTRVSLSGLALAQLAVGVLGVLAVTAEYSTGMISSSLAAVPRRGRLLVAKAAVFAVVATVTGEVLAWAAFTIGQSLIAGKAPSAHLATPGVARAVVGAGLYIGLIGLMGLGIGFILRHTAGSIATVVAMVFVLPAIFTALPSSWSQPIEKYWPTEAGSQVAEVVHRPGDLTAWWGFGELALFVVTVLVVAAWLFRARDA